MPRSRLQIKVLAQPQPLQGLSLAGFVGDAALSAAGWVHSRAPQGDSGPGRSCSQPELCSQPRCLIRRPLDWDHRGVFSALTCGSGLLPGSCSCPTVPGPINSRSLLFGAPWGETAPDPPIPADPPPRLLPSLEGNGPGTVISPLPPALLLPSASKGFVLTPHGSCLNHPPAQLSSGPYRAASSPRKALSQAGLYPCRPAHPALNLLDSSLEAKASSRGGMWGSCRERRTLDAALRGRLPERHVCLLVCCVEPGARGCV